jgi:hypothetical protein
MTNDEILKLYEEGYPPELPRKANFFDLLKPDPLRPQIQAYDRRIAQSSAPVMPQDSETQVNSAPPANRGSFNLSGLTDYIPSASTIGSYIPTSLPNVFGVNNPLYAGLLGDTQSQALSKQSNIAGLLGAAAALVQGMGRQGGRRSAAQNIISALGAGYGSAGQQYQQGLQMYGQAQQLALQQRQQAGVQAMKMKYPDLADEFDTNPAGAFRIVSEREAARVKPTVVSQGGTLVGPDGKVLFTDPTVKEQKTVVINGQLVNAVTGAKIGEAIPSTESDPTTYKEWERLSKGGYKGSYEQYLTDPRFNKAPRTTINNILPSDRAKLLSDNSAKYTANKPVSEAFEIASRYDNFNKAFQNVKAGGASDAVLIYSVAKMLDPGGAVQQGDIETIAGRKSIPEKLQAFHQQFIDNRTLSDEQRENLNSMAYDIYKNKKKAIAPITKQYRNYAASMESPDPTADVQDPFQNIELPKQRSVTINGKKTQVRLGTDKEGNQGYFYTAPNGQIYSYKD